MQIKNCMIIKYKIIRYSIKFHQDLKYLLPKTNIQKFQKSVNNLKLYQV